MDGIHDMGGMDGFGPVHVEEDEPVFHEPWEGWVLAMLIALIDDGAFNTDELRHARERADPVHYLRSSYYELMLTGLEMLLVEKGILSADEVRDRIQRFADAPEENLSERRDPELADDLLDFAYHGTQAESHDDGSFTFDIGDEVVVGNEHPAGHTRCPRYVRRARGVIVRIDGTYSVPDVHAHGGDDAEPVYNVRFDAVELWGDAAEEGAVHLDLWERYLEPVPKA